jgi:hypothetical protein
MRSLTLTRATASFIGILVGLLGGHYLWQRTDGGIAEGPVSNRHRT